MKTPCALKPTSVLLVSAWIACLPCAKAQQTRSGGSSSSSGGSSSVSQSAVFSSSGSAAASAESMAAMMEDVNRAAMQAMERAHREAGFALGGAQPEQPVLAVTSALDDTQAAEWREDLLTLDKLLQDALARAEGRDREQAMGVRLLITGRPPAAPLLLEGAGVVLQGSVRFPLAAAGPGSARHLPAPEGSAWERARQEANRTTRTTANGSSATGSFDPARLSGLAKAMTEVLAEARHLRHLGVNQAVVITLDGRDSAGQPLRATFRANQADLAALAAGRLSAEQFAGRVTRSLR